MDKRSAHDGIKLDTKDLLKTENILTADGLII